MLPDQMGASPPGRDPAGGVHKIAIVRALFLGDLLLSAPAWAALRRRYPRAEITLIGLPWAEELIERLPRLIDRLLIFPGFPGISEVAYDPAHTEAFLAAQRAYGYDLAIQMHGDGTATNGFTQALGARLSVGYARPGDSRLGVSLPYKDDQHETERWLALARLLGAPVGNAQADLQIAPEDHARAETLLAPAAGSGPLVALHLGAKNPDRRWPTAKFAALAAALRTQLGARLVLTGTAAEQPAAAELIRQLSTPILDLTGRTGLGPFAALLSRMDLLATNDTGASHLAAAVGTPSVVLFGPSRPAQFAPLDRWRHRVVDALDFAPRGEDAALALRRLPVENVLAACIAQLSLGKLPAPPGLSQRSVGGEEALCAG